MKRTIKFNEIHEGHIIAQNKQWTCEIDKEHELSLYIEIINMDDATGEPEYKQYPFLVSFEIMAAKPHKSFYEGEGKPDALSLINDVKYYMGGVPIDHILLETDKLNDNITEELKAKDAKLISQTQDCGTWAAQRGKESVLTYPQFKTYEAAEKWAKAMVERYADVHMSLIGFVLDKPINMMGETGWGVIEHQLKGRK